MFSGASGFYNAPLIKLITLSTGVSTFLFPLTLRRSLELSSLEQLTQSHQLWRIFTNNLFFSSTLEAVLGIVLLYHFRLFERQMGPAKFAAFAATTWGTSALVTLAGLVIYNTKNSNPASGPYALIFALIVQYFYEVPATYRFRFLGLNGSNKIMIYLIALQMIGSRFPGSLILGLSGIIAGLAYRSESLPLKRFAIPQPLVKIATKYILPIIQQPRRATQPQRNVHMNARAPPQRPPAAAVAPPAESDVVALMDLGFSREAAIGALRNANNDTQLAAAMLLDPS
eukprot:Phypoly_transcript_13778.p1 GENE.Phypoly_transcript_13778~~Phypoly_transcript_13778.p1  ORF type:complete len:285 (+),score=28.28 Phypoly_transcript_13778:129-983(+)